MIIEFDGKKLDISDDIANQSLSEQELKELLDVSEDEILFTREAGNRSKIVKDRIKLSEGTKLGRASDYFEG